MTRKKTEDEQHFVEGSGLMVPPTPATDVILTTAVKSGNMELYREWKKRQFLRAFAAAQAELPTIIKDREVDYVGKAGRVSYKYEDIGTMLTQVREVLSKHGMSLRFPTKSIVESREAGALEVSAILAHEDGHEEASQMTGYWDSSGGKNQIQAQGSTASYLQRYLTKLVLGFAAAYDDDGRASSSTALPAPMSDDRRRRLLDALDAAKASQDDFLVWTRRKYPTLQYLDDLPDEFFGEAMAKIEEVAKKKKAAAEHLVTQ